MDNAGNVTNLDRKRRKIQRQPEEPGRDKSKKCDAKTTRGEGRCKMPAGFGTDHLGYGKCKHHMGSTPTGRLVGARLAMEDTMRKGSGFYGSPVDVSPAEALLQEVHRTAGHVAWLQNQVGTWEPPADEDPAHKNRQMEALQHLYQRERTRLASVCQIALGAGVAERQVRVAEEYGATIAKLVGGILDGLDLTPAQRQAAPAIVRAQLAAVTSSSAGGANAA